MRMDFLSGRRISLFPLCFLLILSGQGDLQGQDLRLESAQGSNRDEAVPADEAIRPLVIHAAGALEFSLPSSWHLAELAVGREIHLVLTPEKREGNEKDPVDGMWLCCHYRPDLDLPDYEFPTLLEERLQKAAPEARSIHPPEWLLVDDYSAVRREYSQPVTAANAGANWSVGWHALIKTDWGLVEVHASAPLDISSERRADWAEILSSVRLASPQIEAPLPVEKVADAAQILGTWKAMKSQIRLTATGEIEMTFDGRGAHHLGFEEEASSGRTTRLVGHFEAQNDLLFITWEDESRLNLRWRQEGGHLLLTDHNGEVSALRRLLQ